MTQAERLRAALQYLREKGMDSAGSYQKIARKIGYNPNYISDIVNGRFAISDKFADKFQEIFSISREWLLSEKGDMLYTTTAYPSNTTRSSLVSDVSNAEKYLQIEKDNNRLMKDYSEIIRSLQERISHLVDQQIGLVEENNRLKQRISELENS